MERLTLGQQLHRTEVTVHLARRAVRDTRAEQEAALTVPPGIGMGMLIYAAWHNARKDLGIARQKRNVARQAIQSEIQERRLARQLEAARPWRS
jgi:hypothetical protein